MTDGSPANPRPFAQIMLLALFWASLFFSLPAVWNDGTYYAYGWFVPFLCAYLWWQIWPDLRFQSTALNSRLFLPLFFTCLLALRILEKADPYWRLPLWLHAGFVTLPLLLVVRDRDKMTSRLLLLILLGLSAVPPPPNVEQPLIQWLTQRVTEITSFTLNFSGLPTRVLGSQMHVGGQVVAVDEACSGIRSVQALGMVSLFLGLLFRVSLPAQVLLITGSFVLSLFFNTLRALGLTWIVLGSGHAGYEKWHDTLGGLTFLLSSILLYVVAELLRGNPPTSITKSQERYAFTLKPVLYLAAAMILAEVGATWWYARNTSISENVSWNFVMPEQVGPGYAPLRLSETGVGKVLRFNQGAMGRLYLSDNIRADVMYLNYEKNNSRAWLELWGYGGHDLDVCMRSLGSQMEARGPTRQLELPWTKVSVESFLFRRLISNQPQYVYRLRWTSLGHGFDPKADLRVMRLNAVRTGINDYGSKLILAGLEGNLSSEEMAYQKFSEIVRKYASPVR